MNGKLATTTLAAVAATLLAGVALAAPAAAAGAAPAPAAVTAGAANASTYYVYVTGVGSSLDGARANADYKLPAGCYSTVVDSGTTGDGNIWVTVLGTCSEEQ
ncbi:hypothetical protein ACFUCQ_29605 [Streptomyces sp. NPDC057197]|uniref:hypothetical protein n=1 Tax=Streptomyces sp. NPDC057197 TaxID=3346045 RepID=UPI003634F8E6